MTGARSRVLEGEAHGAGHQGKMQSQAPESPMLEGHSDEAQKAQSQSSAATGPESPTPEGCNYETWKVQHQRGTAMGPERLMPEGRSEVALKAQSK